jgi:uncharacterized membrane protein YqjE
MPTNRGAIAVGAAAFAFAIFVVAVVLAISGDPYLGMFALGVMALSALVALVAADWYVRKSREARNATVGHSHRGQTQVPIYLLARNS